MNISLHDAQWKGKNETSRRMSELPVEYAFLRIKRKIYEAFLMTMTGTFDAKNEI